MADFDFTADELGAADRIPRYNERPFNADAASPAYNPWGFDNGGYLTLQMKQSRDTMLMGVAARRFATSASSSAILAAQEAASAKAERQAAQNAATDAYNSAQVAGGKVGLAAAEVDKAKAEVGRAKVEADRAQSYAASLNLPAVTPAMAGRFLKVNAGGTAYELGEVTIASAAEIVAGTGVGLANAQTLGPVLNEIRAVVGDVVDSLNTLSARSNGWIEATNQVLVRATYPQLFAIIGTRYNDFGPIASGSISSSFYATWSSGLTNVAYLPNGVIYALTQTYTQNVSNPKIFRSVDDGLTFSEMTGTSSGFTAPADVIPFKGGFIAPPVFTYDSQNGVTMTSLYSPDGLNWTKDSDALTSGYYTMSYAYSAAFIVGIASGSSAIWYKTNYSGAWTQASLPQQTQQYTRSCIVCLNDVFYYVSDKGNVYKSTNPGAGSGSWTLIFSHPASPSNTRGSIFTVLGSLYVISGYGNIYSLYRVTEAGVGTLLLNVDASIPVVNRDVPNQFSSVQTDGKGRVLLFSGSTAFVLQSDGATSRLNFNFNGYLTGEPVFLRRSDGLSLRIDGASKTVVNRAKVAVADTDFQMPTITSPTSGMKRFVKAKL